MCQPCDQVVRVKVQESLKIFLSYLTKNNENDNINDEDDDNDDDDDSDSCDDDGKNGNDDDDDDVGSNERTTERSTFRR